MTPAEFDLYLESIVRLSDTHESQTTLLEQLSRRLMSILEPVEDVSRDWHWGLEEPHLGEEDHLQSMFVLREKVKVVDSVIQKADDIYPSLVDIAHGAVTCIDDAVLITSVVSSQVSLKDSDIKDRVFMIVRSSGSARLEDVKRAWATLFQEAPAAPVEFIPQWVRDSVQFMAIVDSPTTRDTVLHLACPNGWTTSMPSAQDILTLAGGLSVWHSEGPPHQPLGPEPAPTGQPDLTSNRELVFARHKEAQARRARSLLQARNLLSLVDVLRKKIDHPERSVIAHDNQESSRFAENKRPKIAVHTKLLDRISTHRIAYWNAVADVMGILNPLRDTQAWARNYS